MSLPKTSSMQLMLRAGTHEVPRRVGGNSEIQRGWLNPDHQLFGQVTSRTRQTRLYDAPPSRLTNTEAPKGVDITDD
jgi:hypothetical protein